MNFKINSSKKVWKVLGAAGLAVFMGGMGLFGALGAPANASAASGPDSAAATAGADPFGLDPQNDQVIADLGGLEIKFHNISATNIFDANMGVGLIGYPYITMSDTRNYVIIGMHSSFLNESFRQNVIDDVVQGSTTQWDLADGTPASTAIMREYFNLSGVKTSDTIDKDLKEGQMLCLCTTISSNVYVTGSTNDVYNYSTNTRHSAKMLEVYESFSDAEKRFIAPVSLVSVYGTSTTASTLTNQHVFPLAGRAQASENFHIETYLSKGINMSISTNYWLRSGASNYNYHAYFVNSAGNIGTDRGDYSTNFGVRPAFVLDLNGVHGA